jgi:sulfane dehydrogenase subunit SoxC
MKAPGAGFTGYGQPSRFEDKVARFIPPSPNPATQGVGPARAPRCTCWTGSSTPSGLHFERSHSGIPEVDPNQHRLVIHGLVRRRWCLRSMRCTAIRCTSRIAFIECAGNSQALNAPKPLPLGMAAIHGVFSCAEWTG